MSGRIIPESERLQQELADTTAKLERIAVAYDLVAQDILYDARYHSLAYNPNFKELDAAVKAAGGQ